MNETMRAAAATLHADLFTFRLLCVIMSWWRASFMAQCTSAERRKTGSVLTVAKFEPLLFILALSLLAVRSDSPLLVASFRPPSVPIMGASASTNTMSTFALAQISRFGEHEMQGLLKQCTAIAKREGAEDHTIAASEYR
jgi:hypothetical protein